MHGRDAAAPRTTQHAFTTAPLCLFTSQIAIHTSLGNRIAEFSSVGIGDWYELLLNHTTSPSFDRIGA